MKTRGSEAAAQIAGHEKSLRHLELEIQPNANNSPPISGSRFTPIKSCFLDCFMAIETPPELLPAVPGPVNARNIPTRDRTRKLKS